MLDQTVERIDVMGLHYIMVYCVDIYIQYLTTRNRPFLSTTVVDLKREIVSPYVVVFVVGGRGGNSRPTSLLKFFK